MSAQVPSKDFEPCYCAKCDGKLPAPCRYYVEPEQRPSKELVDWLEKGLEQAEIYRVVRFPTPLQAKIIALAAEVERLRAAYEPGTAGGK